MRWLDCKLINATLCLLTHSHTLNRFKKHTLITYPHSPVPVIIPMIKDPRQSRPNIKVWSTARPLNQNNKLSMENGKGGRDFLISGHFLFLFNTSMCDNDSVPIESPPFSDIHSIDMILIRSSQCSWRTEDEMKHSAILVGLGKQNSCLNYANVTAFLLNRSDSMSPTKLSSRKWHLRLDWQWNKFFGIKQTK